MDDISLNKANAVIAAAIGHATQMNLASTITVVDSAGRTVAVARMDGAPLISVDASAGKARACAFFGGMSTADLASATQQGGPLYGIGDATTEHLAFVPGGLPLMNNGLLIGAVGSGGGMPSEDELVAAAGATAMSL